MINGYTGRSALRTACAGGRRSCGGVTTPTSSGPRHRLDRRGLRPALPPARPPGAACRRSPRPTRGSAGEPGGGRRRLRHRRAQHRRPLRRGCSVRARSGSSTSRRSAPLGSATRPPARRLTHLMTDARLRLARGCSHGAPPSRRGGLTPGIPRRRHVASGAALGPVVGGVAGAVDGSKTARLVVTRPRGQRPQAVRRPAEGQAQVCRRRGWVVARGPASCCGARGAARRWPPAFRPSRRRHRASRRACRVLGPMVGEGASHVEHARGGGYAYRARRLAAGLALVGVPWSRTSPRSAGAGSTPGGRAAAAGGPRGGSALVLALGGVRAASPPGGASCPAPTGPRGGGPSPLGTAAVSR